MVKRIISIIIATLLIMTVFVGCRSDSFKTYDFIDTKYNFDYAVISLPNGKVVEGEIAKWSDSTDGEQLTITFTDGTVYLTSSFNCTLIYTNNQ